MRGLAIILLATLCASPAFAGDPTGYWQRESEAGRAPPKEWWNALASGHGLCCSFADGQRVEDVDWDTQCVTIAGKESCSYRVRLNHEWIEVPEGALVTDPNKFGPAVVWPYKDIYSNTQIRCFMPGAGT